MNRRLTRAILRLYPRRVREPHGHEIMAVIDDLIAFDRRSRAGLLIRLAGDGLVQRLASTVTAWTVAAVLGATTLGALAVSDLAAARPLQATARPHALSRPHAMRDAAPPRRSKVGE